MVADLLHTKVIANDLNKVLLNKMRKSHGKGLKQVLFPSVTAGGTKLTFSWV